MFRRKKNSQEYTFTIDVHRLVGAKTANGKAVYLKWWRGSKSKCGTLKRSMVKDNEAVWESKFSFDTKIEMKTSVSYKPKILVLSVFISNASKELLGRIKLDLTNYLTASETTEMISLDDGACNTAQLELTIYVTEKNSLFGTMSGGLTHR